VGQQYYGSSFRYSFLWEELQNIGDTAQMPSQWSPGQTLIDDVLNQAPLGAVWSVINWAISCQAFIRTDVYPGPAFGKLGRIVGGLVHMTPTVGPVSPMIPFPSNATGLATIWDGATDPVLGLCKIVGNTLQTAPTPLVGQLNLPVPIQVYPGDELQMGLWITPSLAQNAQIVIINATYTVTFDDNQPPSPAVWGGP